MTETSPGNNSELDDCAKAVRDGACEGCPVHAECDERYAEQKAEIDAENAWMRAGENGMPDEGDERERELEANDPWFSLSDAEKQAQWDAYHKTLLPQRTHDDRGKLVPKPYRNFAKGVQVADNLGTVLGAISYPVHFREYRHEWTLTIKGNSGLLWSETAAHLAKRVAQGRITLLPEATS